MASRGPRVKDGDRDALRLRIGGHAADAPPLRGHGDVFERIARAEITWELGAKHSQRRRSSRESRVRGSGARARDPSTIGLLAKSRRRWRRVPTRLPNPSVDLSAKIRAAERRGVAELTSRKIPSSGGHILGGSPEAQRPGIAMGGVQRPTERKGGHAARPIEGGAWTSPRRGPILVEFGPNAAEFGQCLADSGPADLGTNRAQIWAGVVDSGPSLANFGRTRAKVGRDRAKFGRSPGPT